MKRISIIFRYLFLIGLVSSCTSYRFVDLQVLYPAKTDLITPGNTLHIIEPQDTENQLYSIALSDSSYSASEYSRIFIHRFDSALVSYLKESPVFRYSEIRVQDEQDIQQEMKILSTVEQKRHFQLSIKKLWLTDTVQTPPEFIEYDYNYTYVGNYSLSYHLDLNLINIGNPMITFIYPMQDTLIWTGYGDFHTEVDRHLPNTIEAIEETAGLNAREYAQVIAPYWNADKRILLFTNNKYIRVGYRHLLENNPDSAITTWKYLYEKGTERLSAIAAYDIALAYEMRDDLDNCEIWLNNSLKIRKYSETQQYLEEIKRRKTLHVKLDKQLKIN